LVAAAAVAAALVGTAFLERWEEAVLFEASK